MPLRKLPSDGLEPLIRDHLSTEEDAGTARLMRELGPARARGWLTKGELEAVCRWKSPRAIRRVRTNGARQVRAVTFAALRTRSERRRLELLTSLRGVSVPTASAALTLLHPRRYGVLDIRAWQLLHALGAVTKNARGVGFDVESWSRYLVILRGLARTLRVTARDVERTLFALHRAHQRGLLYGPGPRRRRRAGARS